MVAPESDSGDPDELRRELLELAAALSDADAMLARRTDAELASDSSQRLHAACCEGLAALCTAAQHAQLSSADAFRVASAAGLLLETGPRVLAAGAMAGGWNASMPLRHVVAAFDVLVLVLKGWPKAVAAFAGSTGRPAVLLPWLAAVTAGLNRMNEVPLEAVYPYAHVLGVILSSPPYAKHAAAVAADPHLQDRMAAALLLRCLPTVVEALYAGQNGARGPSPQAVLTMAELRATLEVPGLAGGLHRVCHTAGCGGMVVRAACRAVAAIPAQLDEAAGAAACASLHTETYQLLRGLLASIAGWAPGLALGADGAGATGLGSLPGEEQLGIAVALLAVVPHAAEVIQTLAASQDGEQARQLLGITACVAACCTPLRVLHGAELSPQQLGLWAEAADAAVRLQPLLADLARVEPDWQPAGLSEQHDGSEPDGWPSVLRRYGGPGATLSAHLLAGLWLSAPHCPRVVRQEGEARGSHTERVAHQLWRLHGAGCRLLHWLAADGRRQLAGIGPMTAAAWHALLSGLNDVCMHAFVRATVDGKRLHPLLGGYATALFAAHMCAMCTVGAQAAKDAAGLRGTLGMAAMQLLRHAQACMAMAAIAATLPGLGAHSVDAACLAPVVQAVDAAAAAEADGCRCSGGISEADVAGAVLTDAAAFDPLPPPMLAVLVSTGLVSRGVRGVHAMWLGVPEDLRKRIPPNSCDVMAWLKRLAMAATSAEAAAGGQPSEAHGSSGTGHGAPAGAAELAAELAAAGRELDASVEQLFGLRSDIERLGASLVQLVDSAGTRICALLQRWWALQQAAAAQKRDLTAAAVLRSCANLRCANVGLLGGPGAGEGENCRRCIACRTAWYCGVECSRADWRVAGGGHKLLCAEWAEAKAAEAADGSA